MAVPSAGSQLKVEAYGQMLYEGQDSPFIEGDITLGATTYDNNNFPTEVHFDKLAVSAP